jgi:NAD(P)-dependent dehydrogenase (short-subunit alcohol dehydrogenase family)
VSPYAISKAELNLAVAEFHAEYQKDGILFMAISSGMVNSGNHDDGEFGVV